ncbi:UvrD-helicase domain-containing protein [Candidatus Peribacteria bacterium]|nr:UvrD-helicase domain-containing protein [Candidatus Peribacteria bacterium]
MATSTEQILAPLNPQQRAAAEHIHGPLLILAGAGSGKTKSLTHRIAHMMASGIPGWQILAVTFTNKAAKEMQHRVEGLLSSLGQGYETPTMGTFHSVCVGVLRRHIAPLGYDSRFLIYDTGDQEALIKRILEEMQHTRLKPRAVRSHISSAKNLLQTPGDYAASIDPNPFTRAVAEIYPEYQRRLRAANALDFDDLIMATVQLLEHDPKLLEQYQDRWRYLMVDEYQDTNFAQYRLIRLLAGKYQNLAVIGDDSQSIYGFRGADFTNILNFEADFPTATVIKLEQNYRSTPSILANANHLIAQNTTGRSKRLWTENPAGEQVAIIATADEREEALYIAHRMQELHHAGHSYSDMAVLYRMNALSRVLEEALLRQGIPYQITGGTPFMARAEIKDVIAYLRLLFNPADDLAFDRIINVPSRQLGEKTLEVVARYAQDFGMSQLSALQHAEEMEELPKSKRAALGQFAQMYQRWEAAGVQQPVELILDRVLEDTGYLSSLEDGSEAGEMRQQNVRELYSVAGRYAGSAFPLADFLEGAALLSDADRAEDHDGAVTLMTIHASKGLEFPIVFLCGWEDGLFPSQSDLQEHSELEEARRLAYVAITRAKQQLTITHAQWRLLYGQRTQQSPSLFLAELHPEHIEQTTYGTMPQSARSGRIALGSYGNVMAGDSLRSAVFGQEEALRPGMRVRSQQYGEGTVILVNGDVVQVAFAGKGMKKLLQSIAPLEVL